MRFPAAAVLASLIFCGLCAGEETLDAFLDRARRGGAASTYAELDGTLLHRRRGSDALEMPIYFGVIVRPRKTSGQLILDGREGFLVGQSRENGASSSVPQSASTELFDRVGLQISDLTLGFVYYPVLKEEAPQTIGGFVPCRMIRFSVPERPGESVCVAFAREEAFPLRAEFFRAGENEPFRRVEVSGFARKNGLYYARRILTEGPGWRTRIDFDRAEVGEFSPDAPRNVIKAIPGVQLVEM
ncbi:MAG: hypothetical protein MJ016_06235, partial [Victivallaceae bacterium]|nr:hypothetical protein [Victivallaceae bacterium]